MTYQERELKASFYKGVQTGQRKLALWAICTELGIDYIEVME